MVDGIHDLGGVYGFGRVEREVNEPLFHADWEKKTYGILVAYFTAAGIPVDVFRDAIERMDPLEYLQSSYYERWLSALETLLQTRGLPRPQAPAVAADSYSTAVPGSGQSAAFAVGDRVRAKVFHATGHTRSPRYVRGQCGVIERDWGEFAYPETAGGEGRIVPMRLYGVRFPAQELWGGGREGGAKPPGDAVFVDLFEAYLEPAA